MREFNVAVIGVGALGKRHLEALMKSNLKMKIYCVDTNEKTMQGIDIPNRDNIEVVFLTSFEGIKTQIDLAILAMTADKRRQSFENLISNIKVNNIVFEKVLFQTIEDYFLVSNKLKELQISAWVNCAKRQMKAYQNLKSEVRNCGDFEISISGGNWGMACNSIHWIDLVEFLSEEKETIIDFVNLYPEIVDSKRPGFKEVFGTLSGHGGRCRHFSISCFKENSLPMEVVIMAEKARFIIREKEHQMYVEKKENDWIREKRDFIPEYQSEMTQFVAEDILLNGTTNLTNFEDSKRLHLQFIEPLAKFFEMNGIGEKLCPIT